MRKYTPMLPEGKHFRYRKVTPEIKQKMKRLSEQGSSHLKIAKKLGLALSTIDYHLDPKQKEKMFKRAKKSREKRMIENGGKSPITERGRAYHREYFHDRYYNDEEFRRYWIKHHNT